MIVKLKPIFRLNLEILTCEPLKSTMNHPRLIVSIQMEEFISVQRVKPVIESNSH